MKVAEDGGKPISSEVPLSFLFKSTFLMTVSLSFLLSLLSFFRKYPHVTKKRRSSKTDFAPIVPGLVTCGVRVFLSFFFLGRFSPCKTRTYTALRLIDATPTLSRHLRRSPRCGSARCASSGPLQHGVPFRQTAPPAEKKHFPLAQFFLFFFSVPMRDIRQRTMVKIAGMVTLEMATSIGIGFGGFQMPPSGRRGSCAVLWCSAVVLCWGSALCIVV